MLSRSPSRRHSRLRSAGPTSALQVQRALSAAPCTLPSSPGERTRFLTRKLQTRHPSRWAETVRDLIWRQRRGLASHRDVQLLQRAMFKLSAWLAAQRGIGRAKARKRIKQIVERTVSLFIGR